MADPMLALIGAMTLAFFSVVAVVSIAVVAVQAGLALARAAIRLFAKAK